jgi:hypothetical protein
MVDSGKNLEMRGLTGNEKRPQDLSCGRSGSRGTAIEAWHQLGGMGIRSM